MVASKKWRRTVSNSQISATSIVWIPNRSALGWSIRLKFFSTLAFSKAALPCRILDMFGHVCLATTFGQQGRINSVSSGCTSDIKNARLIFYDGNSASKSVEKIGLSFSWGAVICWIRWSFLSKHFGFKTFLLCSVKFEIFGIHFNFQAMLCLVRKVSAHLILSVT